MNSAEAIDAITSFFSAYKLLTYKKRESILRPDDTPSGVYYLRKGYARLYTISQDGEELTLIIFQPGDVFPLMWTFNNIQNKQYLEALTTTELWRAPKEDLLKFLKTHPEVLLVITKNIITRIDGFLERMEHLVFGSAYAKVASILTICAKRFGKEEGKSILIPIPLTHRDLAALIGITRETASVEIKKLEEKGIIKHEKRFFVVQNLPRLEKESIISQ